jgi:hypothetical protein
VIQLTCPYCSAPTRIADASVVYRRPGYGRVLMCSSYPSCDAYVGIHSDRTDGKGSLARGPLRRMRRKCHDLFDPLWHGESPRHRQDVYRAAARYFKVSDFHIGHLREEAAREFIERFPAFKAWFQRSSSRRSRSTAPGTAATAGLRSSGATSATA